MTTSVVAEPDSPFALLGLGEAAGIDEVLAARRRLAKSAHPDVGGDAESMQRINAAAARAIDLIMLRTERASMSATEPIVSTGSRDRRGRVEETESRRSADRRVVEDHPSFTIGALPAVAHAALVLVAPEIGSVLVDEPPYLLEVMIERPRCWCRLEIFPEAGSSSVGLTVSGVDPQIETVRDRWITSLNALDWTAAGLD